MPEHSNWRQRLAQAGGILPQRIRATRKSSREETKQVHSHDQQMAEMNAKWGEIDQTWWWKESRSGTTFDRPGFQDLLDFCRANPRDRADPGRIEWFAPSRFGRSLDDRGEPDILKFMHTYFEFEQSGWQLHFVTLPRLGDGLADVINLAVYAYADAIYSKNLSIHARRGRRQEGEKGWWVNGQAPWGTKRYDTRERRILEPGESSSSGSGGTILVEDPAVLSYWRAGAQSFLAGASFTGVGEQLYEKGLRGPQGGALGHKHIKNYLTNRHLTGEVMTRDAEGHAIWSKAQWEPLVDVELFRKVLEEVARREGRPATRSGRPRAPSSSGRSARTAGSNTTGAATGRTRGTSGPTCTPGPTRPCIRKSTRPTFSTAVAHGR